MLLFFVAISFAGDAKGSSSSTRHYGRVNTWDLGGCGRRVSQKCANKAAPYFCSLSSGQVGGERILYTASDGPLFFLLTYCLQPLNDVPSALVD